jgi:DNA-binding MarR family transcriptional regulator
MTEVVAAMTTGRAKRLAGAQQSLLTKTGKDGDTVVSRAAADTALNADHLAFVELLFFAYRDFISDPDAVLADYGFGRAHHRVLHFVSRQPGLRVADLLDILKITKQSLGPVLKQLVDRSFVMQTTGDADRRERRLHLTTTGHELAARLRSLQTSRVAAALQHARLATASDQSTQALGDPGAAAARAFLVGMIADRDRASVERLLDQEAARLPASELERRSVEPCSAAPRAPVESSEEPL